MLDGAAKKFSICIKREWTRTTKDMKSSDLEVRSMLPSINDFPNIWECVKWWPGNNPLSLAKVCQSSGVIENTKKEVIM